MVWVKALCFVGGAAVAGLVGVASKSAALRKVAVNATAKVLDANDAIQASTQSIMDEADDVRAEADRQRKIDAVVAERMRELEEGVREEVISEIDGKPAKKSTRSSRSKK